MAQVESLVAGRAKRPRAGAKMASLLESGQDEDDFYTSIYGGFEEEADDDDFIQDESSEDEVDSDFDIDEADEPVSQDEGEEDDKKPRAKKKAKMAYEIAAERRTTKATTTTKQATKGSANKVWTQEEILAECKKTEAENVASLRKYQLLELEREKKRRAKRVARELEEPFIRFVSTSMPRCSPGKVGERVERTFIIFDHTRGVSVWPEKHSN